MIVRIPGDEHRELEDREQHRDLAAGGSCPFVLNPSLARWRAARDPARGPHAHCGVSGPVARTGHRSRCRPSPVRPRGPAARLTGSFGTAAAGHARGDGRCLDGHLIRSGVTAVRSRATDVGCGVTAVGRALEAPGALGRAGRRPRDRAPALISAVGRDIGAAAQRTANPSASPPTCVTGSTPRCSTNATSVSSVAPGSSTRARPASTAAPSSIGWLVQASSAT